MEQDGYRVPRKGFELELIRYTKRSHGVDVKDAERHVPQSGALRPHEAAELEKKEFELKLKLHRACIAKLFESSEGVFDAEEIYKLAKEMA